MIEINSVAIFCAISKAKGFCFFTISVQLSTADGRPPSTQNNFSARLPYKKRLATPPSGSFSKALNYSISSLLVSVVNILTPVVQKVDSAFQRINSPPNG